MSCVYCDPKSRTRIFSPWRSMETLAHPVVRGLLDDDHVVDVALLETGRRDAHEARLAPELRDVPRAKVAHAALQAAHQLEHVHGHRALVGHPPLDALGNELLGVGHLGLEVA